MARIILSEVAQFSAEGARKVKPIEINEYKELVCEADKRIKEAHSYYAHAYKSASNCIAR